MLPKPLRYFGKTGDGSVSYFQATIDYCVTKVDYDVTLELASGERCKLEKIHQAIIDEVL